MMYNMITYKYQDCYQDLGFWWCVNIKISQEVTNQALLSRFLVFSTQGIHIVTEVKEYNTQLHYQCLRQMFLKQSY